MPKIDMSNCYAKIVMSNFYAEILMRTFDSENCSIFKSEFGFPGMHFVEMLRLERIIGLYKSCLTGMT